MNFSIPWSVDPSFGDEPLPLVDLLFALEGSFVSVPFLIDSGADVSLAPDRLAEELRIDLGDGVPMEIEGISPKEECNIQGRLIAVEAIMSEANSRIVIPVCFADQDVQTLLGRSAFFDCFSIEFDQQLLKTWFQIR